MISTRSTMRVQQAALTTKEGSYVADSISFGRFWRWVLWNVGEQRTRGSVRRDARTLEGQERYCRYSYSCPGRRFHHYQLALGPGVRGCVQAWRVVRLDTVDY